MSTCPNAYWQLRMRPDGGAWSSLTLYAEPGTDDLVLFPSPYDIGFTLLVFADSQTAPFRVELPDGGVIRLANKQGAILSYTPSPGARAPDGRITVLPEMTRGAPELVPDLTQLPAEPQIRAAYAAGTPLWLWGPGTAAHVKADMQRLGEIITRNPALVKLVPDSGDVRLAGPPVIDCAGAPIVPQPPASSGVPAWKVAAAGLGVAAAIAALVWIARR